MGIWGSETFENDFAEDFLGDHVRLLKRGIEKYLKERHAEKALAAVAALRALAVGIPSASIKISAPDVRKWESQYFDCFDWYYSVGEGEEEEVGFADEVFGAVIFD